MDFPERGEGRFSLVNKLELEVGDVVAYKEFFHMTKEQFSFLLGKVSPLIQKKEQPPPINAVRETIARCNGIWQREKHIIFVEYSFRISRQTISSIASETTRVVRVFSARKFFFFKFAAKPRFADSQSQALNSNLRRSKLKLQW